MLMRIGKKHTLFLCLTGILVIAFSFIIVPIYTKSQGSDEARCDACHVIEADELARAEIHKLLTCSSCHTISDFGSDLYTHDATTEECVSCHTSEMGRISKDAHSKLQNASNESNALKTKNEACVICHTRVGVDIEWHSYTKLIINATKTNGTWHVNYSRYGENITNITKNNTNMTS